MHKEPQTTMKHPQAKTLMRLARILDSAGEVVAPGTVRLYAAECRAAARSLDTMVDLLTFAYALKSHSVRFTGRGWRCLGCGNTAKTPNQLQHGPSCKIVAIRCRIEPSAEKEER